VTTSNTLLFVLQIGLQSQNVIDIATDRQRYNT